MINNCFKIAVRNLLKSKLFSFVNIVGLAVGLTAFWLILLYVGYELSFENFHKNADRIYRVVQHATWPSGSFHLAPTSAPFAQALTEDYPEIEEAVRINPEGGGIITHGEKHIAVDAFFADHNIFNVLTFNFLYGDPATSLVNPQAIVLTETLAEKIFGDPSTALGQTVYFENNYENKVTGVIADVPANTHLQFAALRSLPENYTSGWQNMNLHTYLLLRQNVDIKHLQTKIPQFFEKHLKNEMGELDYELELQPLASIHLHSHLDYELSANGDIKNIYIFMAATILIIIIAAINYMNLTAIRSSLRIREIGVRKVIGAGKPQLMGLFLCEAMLVSFLAMFLALVLSDVLLPHIEDIAGLKLSLMQFGVGKTIIVSLALVLLIGVICGLYPAFFLSNFKTIAALKGQIGNISTNILIRKSLVVLQFVIAIVMITGSWAIYSQLKFALQKDLGFNKDQVLTFHLSTQESREKIRVLKNELLESTFIEEVAAASNPIGNNNIGSTGFLLEQTNGEMSLTKQIAHKLSVDEDFIRTLDIELIEGRNFSPDYPADAFNAVLVNEALVKKAGWKEAAGKRIQFENPDGKLNEAKVVGVVKDFHTYSLQHSIEPLVLYKIFPEDQDNVYVKVQANKIKQALAFIKEKYARFDPKNPLEFHFLDENFAKQYQAEQRQGRLLLIFTILAVFLALIGLFGLTAFSVAQRNKEVGVRKILGASTINLVTLLSKDFIKLIVVAFFIAVPLAWFAISKWLQNFAYRTNVEWWIFALTGIAIVVLTFFTIGYQSIRAALANPVDSLKEE